jgi:dTDP-4-amino-4,6-dideoxygalactose transaminase
MVTAINQSEKQPTVRFYEVNYDLKMNASGWLEDVKERDLVVFIDYFGFPYDNTYAIDAQKKGAWIIEDASQSLLSTHIGHNSDFVLFSPRKFLGVPDGGILKSKIDVELFNIKLQEPPANWWLQAFTATVLRREFDLYGGDRRWFPLFREADINGPIGPYSISELSKFLLRHCFDYPSISKQRIENYNVLSHILDEFALFTNLPTGVVPLGFPIRLKNRDQVRNVLFEHNIYPPVHWPIHSVVPKDFTSSHRLADDIMTLLCDQRCNPQDMERMAEIVLQEGIPA